jgi:hypothetical protein
VSVTRAVGGASHGRPTCVPRDVSQSTSRRHIHVLCRTVCNKISIGCGSEPMMRPTTPGNLSLRMLIFDTNHHSRQSSQSNQASQSVCGDDAESSAQSGARQRREQDRASRGKLAEPWEGRGLANGARSGENTLPPTLPQNPAPQQVSSLQSARGRALVGQVCPRADIDRKASTEDRRPERRMRAGSDGT